MKIKKEIKLINLFKQVQNFTSKAWVPPPLLLNHMGQTLRFDDRNFSRIVFRTKKISKAIQAYEILILKYPEK
jgi:hypothetical protein